MRTAYVSSIYTLKRSCICASLIYSHLRVLEKSVFLDAFNEHELVVAVSGPVEEVLNQVLVILKNTFWQKEQEKSREKIQDVPFFTIVHARTIPLNFFSTVEALVRQLARSHKYINTLLRLQITVGRCFTKRTLHRYVTGIDWAENVSLRWGGNDLHLLTYPFVVQWWFPPETSQGYSRSETYPAGCPAPAWLSAAHPPSWSWSFRLTCGPWSQAEEQWENRRVILWKLASSYT